jgi:murein tripeptide amidase MpaA
MLRVFEGYKSQKERFGVWVQARQHAWESGSSWVARGFMEWVLGDSEKAETLRWSAEIMGVPVMDVDNTATGNGGKDALPYDHNRDWSDLPNLNETKAAQARVKDLIQAGRMDVFLDLHNPGPDDPTFFFLLDPARLKS